MDFQRTITNLGLAALFAYTAFSAGCSTPNTEGSIIPKSSPQAYSTVAPDTKPKIAIAPRAETKISLEGLVLDDCTILSRNINPNSKQYLAVILESHARDHNLNVNKSSRKLQPTQYKAGIALINAGFTNIFQESLPYNTQFNNYLSDVADQYDLDFSAVQHTIDPIERQKIIEAKYLGKGVDISILTVLTYPEKVTFKGAEDQQSRDKGLKMVEHLNLLSQIAGSDQYYETKQAYKRKPNTPELKERRESFNSWVDFVCGNYHWFIEGRSTDMVNNISSDVQNGLLFVGANHYASIKDELQKKDVNYVIIFPGKTTEQAIISKEQKAHASIEDLKRFKF